MIDENEEKNGEIVLFVKYLETNQYNNASAVLMSGKLCIKCNLCEKQYAVSKNGKGSYLFKGYRQHTCPKNPTDETTTASSTSSVSVDTTTVENHIVSKSSEDILWEILQTYPELSYEQRIIKKKKKPVCPNSNTTCIVEEKSDSTPDIVCIDEEELDPTPDIELYLLCETCDKEFLVNGKSGLNDYNVNQHIDSKRHKKHHRGGMKQMPITKYFQPVNTRGWKAGMFQNPSLARMCHGYRPENEDEKGAILSLSSFSRNHFCPDTRERVLRLNGNNQHISFPDGSKQLTICCSVYSKGGHCNPCAMTSPFDVKDDHIFNDFTCLACASVGSSQYFRREVERFKKGLQIHMPRQFMSEDHKFQMLNHTQAVMTKAKRQLKSVRLQLVDRPRNLADQLRHDGANENFSKLLYNLQAARNKGMFAEGTLMFDFISDTAKNMLVSPRGRRWCQTMHELMATMQVIL